MVKIEIGGQRRMDGWVNLGIRDSSFDIMFDDIPYDNVSEFYWSHVIEHIPVCQITNVISKMYNKLQPGGRLRTVCPDLEQICRAYLNGDEAAFKTAPNHWSSFSTHYEKLGIGGMFLAQFANCKDPTPNDDENLLFSKRGQRIASLSHVAGYDFEMLKTLLLLIGFSRVERTGLENIDPHQKQGQLCVNAYK